MADSTVRKRPHDNDLFRDGNCPGCGVKTEFEKWWCAECLQANVRAARASLESCSCMESDRPHRHALEGGVL